MQMKSNVGGIPFVAIIFVFFVSVLVSVFVILYLSLFVFAKQQRQFDQVNAEVESLYLRSLPTLTPTITETPVPSIPVGGTKSFIRPIPASSSAR